MCGGDIKATDNIFGTCEACGSIMTLVESKPASTDETPIFIPKICKDKYINDEIAKAHKSISTCDNEIASARIEISSVTNEENRILDEQRRAAELYWMQHSGGFTESGENRVYTEMLKSVWERKHRAENSIREWNQIKAESETKKRELEALLLLTPEVRAERHYQTLIDTKDGTKSAEEFAVLAQKFREMEGYKDAEKLAVECDDLSKSVKKQCEEKERKEKEQKAAQERKEKEQKAAQERKEAEKAQKKEVRELNAVIDSIRAHGVIMEKKLSEWQSQVDEWKAKGLCAHCGGKLGLFKSCKVCKKRISDIPVYDRSNIPIATVSLGAHNWRILDVESDRALLLSNNIIDSRCFHPTKSALWKTCKLREHLNGWFINDFNN
jgi:chemotaxis protein histidine kinase CheA